MWLSASALESDPVEKSDLLVVDDLACAHLAPARAVDGTVRQGWASHTHRVMSFIHSGHCKADATGS